MGCLVPYLLGTRLPGSAFPRLESVPHQWPAVDFLCLYCTRLCVQVRLASDMVGRNVKIMGLQLPEKRPLRYGL